MKHYESLEDACNAGADPGAVVHGLCRPGDTRAVGWSGASTHPDAPTMGSGTGFFREPRGLGLLQQASIASMPDPRSPAGRRQDRAVPAMIPSGAHWVARFAGSTQVADLEPAFRLCVEEFQKALHAARAHMRITSTYRPPERAFLMHWSWMIVKKGIDPRKIPAMIGIPINWWHGTLAASKSKAREMVNGYGIAGLKVAPALRSRHTQGKAIDMHVSWGGVLEIQKVDGSVSSISTTPRDSTNADLIEVGSTYGVIHFDPIAKDRPHWSTDGR